MSGEIPLSFPFLPASLKEEVLKSVASILDSGWLMQGKHVSAFEVELGYMLGHPHVVAVANGTTALHMAIRLLGIGAGDEVIVPSFSFVATGNCVLYEKATPVFCDLIPGTFNMDPSNVETLITPKTKAIMAVHQFGMPCEIQRLKDIAQKHKLLLIEDAACALGSRINNMPVGAHGDIACFSFHPRKVVTTGEGGALVIKNRDLFESAQRLRSHGLNKNQEVTGLGYNYRMTEMQAALGIAQLKHFPAIWNARREAAYRYHTLFSKMSNAILPIEATQIESNYQSYAIQFHGPDGHNYREAAHRALTAKEIQTRKGIPPMHLMPHFSTSPKYNLPVTQEVAGSTLILPLYETLSLDQQKTILEVLI